MSDLDEWRSDTRRMTELEGQLSLDEPRRARGLAGDKDDAND